jgi:K+-sensing histidine kinase KdpD
VQFVKSRVLAASPPTPPTALLWAAAAAVVPTLIRAALDGVLSGSAFLAYFPFLVAAAMFLGWRSAMVTTALSALAANFLFLGPRNAFAESVNDVAATLLFLMSASAVIFGTETLKTAARPANLDRGWSRPARTVSAPLRRGYGLVLGAVLSLALWAGAIWAVMKLFA